jgi:WD40 repeat protein
MSVSAVQIYAPHPLPTRGIAFFLGYSEKLNRIAYCWDTFVWQRGVEDIFDAAVYAQHRAKTTVAAYSPTTRYIATADDQGNLRVWAPEHKEQILTLETRPIAGPIYDLGWTEDNERLAYVGNGGKSFGGAINATTGASIGEVMGHTATVRSCGMKIQRPFRLVTAGDDMQHVFYKGPPFKFDHTGSDHTKFISVARFAPDGSVYATAGLDGKIALYEGATGHFVTAHQLPAGITSIAFSPDSKQILTAQMDGKAVIVAVDTGAVAKEWSIGPQVYQQQCGVLWTKRNKISVSLNGDFNYLADDGTFTVDRGHTAAVTYATPIPGGFASGDNGGQVLFWKYGERPYAVYGTEGGLPNVTGLTALPDGKVAVGRGDGSVLVLANADGALVATYNAGKKATGPLVTVAGGAIATFVEKALVIIAAGNVKTIALPFTPTTIAVSPDGAEIAIGGNDKTVHLYDPEGAVKGAIPGLLSDVAAIGYSPDGTKIAASSENKEIVVWNRSDVANPIIDGWRFHSLAVTKILFLADNVGLVTISKDRSIRLWSTAKRRASIELARAHEQQINDGFWIDDNTLLTVGFEGAIRTWKVQGIK